MTLANQSENDTGLIISDQDVRLDGVALRVRSIRHEPETPRSVLVFLHDSLGCIALWRDFPVRLAKATGCNALVYDRRGYGQLAPFGETKRTIHYLEDEAQVLGNVLSQCGVERAILFGHSDGGSIALVAAAEFPDRIAGVITEGAHVFVEELTLAGIRAAQAQYRTTDLGAKLAKYHGIKTEAVFRAWADTWLAPEFRAWNIEPYLPQIQCPVLVLQGERDEYGTAEQVAAVVSQVQDARPSKPLPGLGHTPHKEAAELVLELAAAFVAAIQ
ncbi:alpha/beta fold hydrolase [Hymenobacter sp. BT491]|uniref:alpha/beta fold hydrolase n=1 Tax=Hymenobacter sp. BT491 TaxID=2766779 RepID=UPI001CA3BA16|nr:alpha/beta hydrolase [Hymenobacter sp. BT491]